MKRLLVFSALALLIVPFAASAHERQVFRMGSTDYQFVVGSLNEPVFVDDKTGVDLRVQIVKPGEKTGTPVTGLETELKVEISASEQKKVFDLSPAYNDPGAYRAPFYPTVATTLKYRFFGTLAGTSFDYAFTCNPAGHPQSEEDTSVVKVNDSIDRVLKAGAFGCPRPKADAAFPEAILSTHESDMKTVELNARLDNLSATSRTFTYLALLLGLSGLIVGLAAMMRIKKNAA